MLPPHLTGSYQRYKANTTVFTTWLAITSKACGYQIAACRRNRTQQPAFVEINGLKRFTYPIGDIPRQARAIAESEQVGLQLPSSIQQSAERAIEGRIAFADLLKDIRGDELEDTTHAYFLDTLKEALAILKAA
jgi:hypothetical protein